MHVQAFGNNTIQIDKEYYETFYKYDPAENLEDNVNRIIRVFTHKRSFQKLLDAHTKATGLEGFSILQAHGTKSSPWRYGDGEKRLYVQNWIDRMDGYALALLIYACNESNQEIHSNSSIVIHASCIFNNFQFDDKKVPVRIYVPRYGYLENNPGRLKRVISRLMVA